MRAVWTLLRDAYYEWSDDNAPRLGAALSYYTVFSVAPLLILSIAVVGLVFGEEAARGQVMGQIRGLVGDQVAGAVQGMIASSRDTSSGILATLVGLGTLLFGASGVFTELQASMNQIWDVPPRPGGVWGLVKGRFFSFAMVLAAGFLLLVSLILSAALSAVAAYFQYLLPRALSEWAVYGIDLGASLAIFTVLFALMFRVLPDTRTAWRDVWFGAVATALLFAIGKTLIGLYLGRSSVTSTYGAAGSLIVLLLWVYYSAQILFYGAELTQVYARRYGSQAARGVPVPEQRGVRAA
ncbi:MAG: YihY/virulence factor BrkB family protein [Candidatus Methylomirabilales bacterium]